MKKLKKIFIGIDWNLVMIYVSIFAFALIWTIAMIVI
jgi:hypothetical protein